jgi:predicted RNA-binding Zn-ribbon protein involved in translation (DUF1610 family)
MDIKGYKCPNCGGTVQFDSASQKMKCPFCDTEFDREALEEHQREVEANAGTADSFEWNAGNAEVWENPEADDLATGCCPSCGAELYGGKDTVAMVCPCCGNAQIVAKRLSGMLKPDCVIPFKLDKNAARAALSEFCKGKPLLPKYFAEDSRLDAVQGVYAPFWLFDARAEGRVSYKATKVKTWTSGNYRHTQTSHYSVVREGSLAFEKIPVDGSEKMDDNYMDAIEPFDYKQLEAFHTSYLAGYAAEKYDVDAEKCKPRAESRIKKTIEDEFRGSVTGYNSVTAQSSSVSLKEGKASYGLFPVWTLNTKYKEEDFLFMMNGQTGKLVGKLPTDAGKSWMFRALFAALFCALLSPLLYYLGSADIVRAFINVDFTLSLPVAIAISFVISAVGGFLVVHSWICGMNTARPQTDAFGYTVLGSLAYKVKSDKYLYSTTSRVALSAARR